MALLQLLLDLQHLHPLSLVVAHCDHRVRSDSSDNAAAVVVAARAHGLRCLISVAQSDVSQEVGRGRGGSWACTLPARRCARAFVRRFFGRCAVAANAMQCAAKKLSAALSHISTLEALPTHSTAVLLSRPCTCAPHRL